MKSQVNNNHEEAEIEKPVEKKTRKNKTVASKNSKASHATRRRQQPDSSEQYMMPDDVPKSDDLQSSVIQGKENEQTKVVLKVPFAILKNDTFLCGNLVNVQNEEILISVKKDNDNIAIYAQYVKSSGIMEIQQQEKGHEDKQAKQDQSEEKSVSNIETPIIHVNIFGKYVYFTGFETQNKVIKQILKQINTAEAVELIKFKIKDPNSDLLIYLNLRIEEYLTLDYNGLVNQGNTCYMNSYLQTLYHIPAFRNLVFEAEIQDQGRFPATLQELFFNLRTAEKAVSPEFLVKSFGWGRQETAIQQDAQEFSCLFFEVLERKLNESAPKQGYKNRTIEGLFKGQLAHYMQCTHVGTVIYYADFRRENHEQFIDLQLPIYPTLQESLNEYTSEVHMEGDNKYMTDEFGLQQAFKGVKIAYFPPILMIQLKRFHYDFQQEKNIKILQQLEYTERFDFGPWSISGQKQEYELYAVLVHEGSRAESGHYYNFVKIGEQWYKFNDERVQLVPKYKVLEYNFGGYHESIDFDAKEMRTQKKLVEFKTTAYMLVYIKLSLKEELMQDQGLLPEWIYKKNANKLEIQEMKKNRRKFYHNVGFIDWEKALQGKTCADIGFLDEIILENSKQVIQQVPKQANISEWLASENILQLPTVDLKKKSKKSKITKSEGDQVCDPGIYVYYVTLDRQILSGFVHKPHHVMQDLLKISPDAIIFKAPFQVKKQEYFCVIKRFRVSKNQGQISIDFRYDSVVPIKKEISYLDMFSFLENKYKVSDNNQIRQEPDKQFNFYIDDEKLGLIKLIDYTGQITAVTPSKNQLLICVVEELPCDLSIEQQVQNSFVKWYQKKKGIVSLTVAEEKTGFTFLIKQAHQGMSLTELRKLIFELVLKEKKEKYESYQNIILKARLKKTAKIYSQVTQPEFSILADLIKIQPKIQFGHSSISVESRLSQYEVQFHYRFKDKQNYSEPIKIIIGKDETNEQLVKKIKTHPIILSLLKQDGFEEDEAEIILLSKDRLIINDTVNKEGKIYAKGDLDVVIKKQKNAVLAVEGTTILPLEGEPKVQIKQEDTDPMISILLHHVSQSIERVGNPRYFKVDRRMELFEFKNKILDLIKDQTYWWEGKFYVCNPFKVRIRLYSKDNKKVIDLTDIESWQEMKRLRIEDKTSIEPAKRKKSKDLKNMRKESTVFAGSDLKQVPIQETTVVEGTVVEQQMDKLNETVTIKKGDLDLCGPSSIKQKEKRGYENLQEAQNKDHNKNGVDNGVQNGHDPQKDQEDGNELEPASSDQVQQVTGPQTIYGIFPKVKMLKVQIIHNYLIKPNIVLRLNVDH